MPFPPPHHSCLYTCHDKESYCYCGNVPNGDPSISAQCAPKYPRFSSYCCVSDNRHTELYPFSCDKRK